MIPEFTHEASYRFGNTYVKAMIEGEEYVVKLYDHDGPNNVLVAEEGLGDISIPMTDVDFSYPALGYINTATSAVYMSRYPDNFVNGDRVYKRGWRLHDCEHQFLADNRCIPSAKDVFYPKYPSWEEVGSIIADTPRAIQAFSPAFALAKYENRPLPVLFYHSELVGYLKDGMFMLPSVYDYVAEELREFNDTIKTEVNGHES